MCLVFPDPLPLPLAVPFPLSFAVVFCRCLLAQRLAGAPVKVQAGIKDLVDRGIAVEWDIDVRVTNAFLGVRRCTYVRLVFPGLLVVRRVDTMFRG